MDIQIVSWPIDVLRASPVFAPLTPDDLAELAERGQMHEYAPGQTILEPGGRDQRVFVLCRGKVRLHLEMWTEGGRCGGEAEFELAEPGATFGWARWVKSERITASAEALEATNLLAVNLSHPAHPDAFVRASQRMILELYARLQEAGLCPPNLQALLALQQDLRGQEQL